MDLFFELEIVYIVIGAFILSITAFVTSRDFVAYNEIKDKDGNVVDTVPTGSFKKGMSVVSLFVLVLIGFHYNMTTSRMANIEEMFKDGETIICENKMRRTISNSILLSKNMGWRLENHLFKNSDYERDFHTSRCVEWIGSQPQIEEAKRKAAELEKLEKEAIKNGVLK